VDRNQILPQSRMAANLKTCATITSRAGAFV